MKLLDISRWLAAKAIIGPAEVAVKVFGGGGYKYTIPTELRTKAVQVMKSAFEKGKFEPGVDYLYTVMSNKNAFVEGLTPEMLESSDAFLNYIKSLDNSVWRSYYIGQHIEEQGIESVLNKKLGEMKDSVSSYYRKKVKLNRTFGDYVEAYRQYLHSMYQDTGVNFNEFKELVRKGYFNSEVTSVSTFRGKAEQIGGIKRIGQAALLGLVEEYVIGGALGIATLPVAAPWSIAYGVANAAAVGGFILPGILKTGSFSLEAVSESARSFATAIHTTRAARSILGVLRANPDDVGRIDTKDESSGLGLALHDIQQARRGF